MYAQGRTLRIVFAAAIAFALYLLPGTANAAPVEYGVTQGEIVETYEIAPFESDAPSVDSRGIGTFTSVAQRPHVSAGSASAHGCWRLDGPRLKGHLANVEVWLQVRIGSSWVTMQHGEANVYPGCGGGKDAVAKHRCMGPQDTLWRTKVDVDVLGVLDTPRKAYHQYWIECTP